MLSLVPRQGCSDRCDFRCSAALHSRSCQTRDVIALLTYETIVSANTVDVEGSDGRQDFDESVAVFDNQQ